MTWVVRCYGFEQFALMYCGSRVAHPMTDQASAAATGAVRHGAQCRVKCGEVETAAVSTSAGHSGAHR
jgi:hypothetical protein